MKSRREVNIIPFYQTRFCAAVRFLCKNQEALKGGAPLLEFINPSTRMGQVTLLILCFPALKAPYLIRQLHP